MTYSRPRKTPILAILFVILTVLPLNIANAQFLIPNSSIINQDQVSRAQDRQIQQKKIEQEIENIKRKKNIKSNKIKAKSKIGKIAKCFLIKEFQFSKSQIISNSKLIKITNPYLDQCFSANLINEVKNKINLELHEKGYITSQAILPQQNINSGLVKIDIIQGKINQVKLNNEELSDMIQKFLLFGDLSEEILDVRDLNQGLYQMNKLPSNNAKIKIIAADKNGYSDIILNNEGDSLPIRGSISHDNFGSNFTGVRRTTFSSSTDNILSLSEVIDLSFTNNLNDNNNKKEMESASTTITIPFRYYTISYSYIDTDYMGKTFSEGNTYTVNGYARRKTFSITKSIINQQTRNLNASISLIQKNIGSETLVQSAIFSTSHKRLTIIDLSLSFSNYSKYFNIYLKPTILKGIDRFSADKDTPGQAKEDPHSQYTAYRLYLNIGRPITINNTRINLSSEFDSQISNKTLNGSEQFSVGGYYSVRGFRENFISGDHGYYLRNKASINLANLISPKLTFETFFDYGQVKDKIGSASGRLSGAGANLIYNSKYFDATISYANSLTRSKLFDSSKKENHLFYFQTSLSF